MRRIQKTMRNINIEETAKKKGACQRDQDVFKAAGEARDIGRGKPGVYGMLVFKWATHGKEQRANDK